MIGVETNVLARDYIDDDSDASYRQCDRMATFDNRRFVRRDKRLGLSPPVTLCR